MDRKVISKRTSWRLTKPVFQTILKCHAALVAEVRKGGRAEISNNRDILPPPPSPPQTSRVGSSSPPSPPSIHPNALRNKILINGMKTPVCTIYHVCKVPLSFSTFSTSCDTSGWIRYFINNCLKVNFAEITSSQIKREYVLGVLFPAVWFRLLCPFKLQQLIDCTFTCSNWIASSSSLPSCQKVSPIEAFARGFSASLSSHQSVV